MAEAAGVILRSRSSTSMLSVSGSQSTKTGVQPFQTAACAVAVKVKLGIRTCPCTPSTRSASMRPEVQLLTATASRPGSKASKARSSSATVRPLVISPEAQISRKRGRRTSRSGRVGDAMGKWRFAVDRFDVSEPFLLATVDLQGSVLRRPRDPHLGSMRRRTKLAVRALPGEEACNATSMPEVLQITDGHTMGWSEWPGSSEAQPVIDNADAKGYLGEASMAMRAALHAADSRSRPRS